MSKKAGTDENGDVKGTKLEDSNMANYGSKEHVDARKAAAASEKEFVGAGVKPGLEVWRVENRRTKSDTPDFGVKRWPKEDYGNFFSGDSYLVLNTYKVKVDGKETDKLAWDVHFWLGKDSSQDEIGVAAYKAVELDDLLDDGPVQHREVQGSESPLFQSYFKGITYMEGGIASGFRTVKPEEYKPRLFQVRQASKTIRAFEVPVKATSLDKGDTFILDAGLKIYIYIGPESNAFEKSKGGALAHNIVSGRQGKAKLVPELDDEFWKILGGSEKDIKPANTDLKPEVENMAVDSEHMILYQLSDASGKITFTKKAEGKINGSMFDSNDVFILDGKVQLFVWVGKGASHGEKSQAMKFAEQYMKDNGRPMTLPVTRITEGQVHHVFGALIKW
jgi:gelsolin